MNETEYQELLKELKADTNKWRVFRKFLGELSIWEKDQDYIQGFVGEMFNLLQEQKVGEI